MGGGRHEFVPSERISPETSLPRATSVPIGARRHDPARWRPPVERDLVAEAA
jgi:hypothetical protein